MMAAVNHPMTAPEWSMLLTLSVLWGGSFFFVGIAVHELPPLTIVVLRVAIAAIALHLTIRILGERLPKHPDVWVAFVAMGFLNNLVPFVLIVWAQTRIASGVASILNATTPLFTVLLAHLLTTDEKMTGGRLLGVVGFTGVAVMIGGAALQALGGEFLAQLAILAAGVSYACAGVFGRRFRAMGVTPARHRHRTADRVEPDADPAHADRRHAVDFAPAVRAYHRRRRCTRAAVDRTRLHSVFPHPRDRGRDKSPARHLPDPGQRHRAGNTGAGRGAAVKSPVRHGLDRTRACGD